MNSTVRKDESLVCSFKNQSDEGFYRLAKKVINSEKHPKNELKILPQAQASGRMTQKSAEAYANYLSNNQNKWLKKRGYDENLNSSHLAKKICKMIDPQETGKIALLDFVKFLVEIGVPLSSKVIKSILCKIVGEIDTNKAIITEDHINLICRGDKKTNAILYNLNSCIKIQLNKPCSEITTADQDVMINSWWKTLDSYHRNQVCSNQICDFMVKTQIFPGFSEGKKFMNKVTNFSPFLDSIQFRLIFSKALIKQTLLGIDKKLAEEDLGSKEHSYAIKFCQLKRKLILAGSRCAVPNVTTEEGSIVLKAIKSFARLTHSEEPNINLKDLKKRWHRRTGINVDKAEKGNSQEHKEKPVELARYFPKDTEMHVDYLKYNDDYRPKTLVVNDSRLRNRKFTIAGSFNLTCGDEDQVGVNQKRRHFKPINSYESRCERVNTILQNFQKMIYKS